MRNESHSNLCVWWYAFRNTLIIYPLSKIIVDSLLKSVVFLTHAYWLDLHHQTWNSSCGVCHKLIQKSFFILIAVMPLLCLWPYSCQAGRYYTLQGSQLWSTVDYCFPQQAALQILALCKLSKRDESPRSEGPWFIFLCLKYTVPSAIGSPHQILLGNQEQWNQPLILGDL